jgi:hypothetical protein
MSRSEVTRDGTSGDRPGREAQMWHAGGGTRRDARRPVDHPRASYYGKPIINPPVWEERDIAGYLFLGGLAGASSLLAAGADATARPVLARRAKTGASVAIGLSLFALIHDLGRPMRFINMLRVLKITSPMSVGTWILSVYTPLNLATTGSDLFGVAPRAGRVLGAGAGLLGTSVASYTAALIANTAVPAWHEAHRELPFLFVSSATAAGAGLGLIVAPRRENAPAVRMAVAGAAGELAVERLIERRLGTVAPALKDGRAGNRLKAARALSAGGGLLAAALARRSRSAAVVAGGALMAGSALTRLGIFAAGMASAEDPRYTVEPQRARAAGRHA